MATRIEMNPYLRRKQVFDQFGGLDDMNYGIDPINFNTEPYAAGPVMDPRPPSLGNSYLGADMGMNQAPPQSNTDPELQAIMDALNQGYTPDYTSRDRFNQHLDAAPQRGKPSFARKLVASGMSLKADDPIGTAEKVMYAPYLRDQAEWTSKNAPYAQAAQLENVANTQERTLVGNAATAASAQRRADVQAENARLRAETEDKRIASREKIEAARREVAMFKQLHPDWEIISKGTNIIAVNPQNPSQTMDLGPSTNFSPMELESLRQKGRTELEGQRQSGRETIVIMQGDQNRQTKAVDGGDNKPLDVLRERNNKFLQIADTYPQLAEKWFIPPSSPGDNWRIKTAPTAGFWSNNEKEIAEYNQVRQLLGIDPTPAPNQQPTSAASPNATTGVGPTVVPNPTTGVGGRTRYMQPSGPTAPATRTGVGGVQQSVGAGSTEFKTQSDPDNPMNKRRSTDGGKTWEYSTDGGKTWKKR
jgi:hypothetical protein